MDQHDDGRTLAQALDEAAARLRAAADEAAAAHARYVRLGATDSSRRRLDAAVSHTVRVRRTEAALYAAGALADAIAVEAADAHRRFPDVDASGDPLVPAPPSPEPSVVADWWARLDDDERADVLTRAAGWAGRTDGMPAAVRDHTNRQVLTAEIARRRQLATGADLDLPHDPPDEAAEREARDLRGLLLLQDVLRGQGDENATPAPERHLYLLDARAYPLKCAVVLGDLERATHVVVHVPGATTTVEHRLVRELTWMSHLRAETMRLLPQDAHVAVVDWIGYQAPYDIAVRRALGDSGMKVVVPGEASDDRYAREAAPSLARAIEGLRVLRPRARLVVSGHSYGASTLGLALREVRGVDAAMVTGCPGLFTASLDVLGLQPGRLYVAVGGGDLVAALGLFGGHPLKIPGSVMLSPLARTTTYPDGSRALLKLVVGHEQYYNEGTHVLHGLAAVAAGDIDRVRALRGTPA